MKAYLPPGPPGQVGDYNWVSQASIGRCKSVVRCQDFFDPPENERAELPSTNWKAVRRRGFGGVGAVGATFTGNRGVPPRASVLDDKIWRDGWSELRHNCPDLDRKRTTPQERAGGVSVKNDLGNNISFQWLVGVSGIGPLHPGCRVRKIGNEDESGG